ncbi:rhamnan synthesis F family protein [Arcicella rosea]|uniref:Rhamnosyltransferase n=1 Tax=Arcicella rosea TaxID=502909 RepID=A0A841EJ66_9BACT|nr:rhamnan synthesis F family protein [Arcicella rosea]MBB6001439.1 rhamnosyltransferase [Arcicella rosea]
MKRIGLYLFYDKDGVVDDYVIYKLRQLRQHVDYILFISNSSLNGGNLQKAESVSDEILCRENVGFDVWGYKEGLAHIGKHKLALFDELILLNYTFFGPIYPFSELFKTMESSECDFWGISDHGTIAPNPFTGKGVLPVHIQSHFIAVRSRIFKSDSFKQYWETMPQIKSYDESVEKHESRFTEHFHKLGFKSCVYCSHKDYSSNYPLFYDSKEALSKRIPILKRRPFFHEPLFIDKQAVDLKETLEFIKTQTSYPVELIWQNVLRTTRPKDLYSNLDLVKVFSSEQVPPLPKKVRIAVLAHVFYPDMLTEIHNYLQNIPCDFDLIITTGSQESAKEIEVFPFEDTFAKHVKVYVVEQNRGRDMAALFITCRDINLIGEYDYICRIHSKKSPQVTNNASQLFKKHMFESLLSSKGYVQQLIAFFEDHPEVGMMIPSMIHSGGFPTLGHSWFTNKERTVEIAEKLDIKVPFDYPVPHAAFGTMFWYRPEALKRLFEYPWQWDDFDEEPNHQDGSLAHALERLLVYMSHDSGYVAYVIAPTNIIASNYARLEYKANRIMALHSSGDVFAQVLESIGMNEGRILLKYVKLSIKKRFPRLVPYLKILYTAKRKFFR